jgi:hypothetical protein
MTQTIKNCNELPQGKTYDSADLRAAESIEQLCALVDAGNPIANNKGQQVFMFQRFNESCFAWNEVNIFNTVVRKVAVEVVDKYGILNQVKLAPLAYRNGRPLHVGDVIKIQHGDYMAESDWWDIEMDMDTLTTVPFELGHWRFADEVEK